MSAKIIKIVVVLWMALLIASCNQSQAGRSGSSSSSNQTQSSQSGSSNQPQPSQADKNNPSAFQGGITVRDGYDQALPKTLEWSPTAVLSEVNQTTINQEGKSKSWTYYFADDTLKSAADRSMGFYVIVVEKGVTEANTDNINVGDNLLQANIADWKIDASQALTACEQVGGAELRASNPAIFLDAWLMMHDYQVPNGMPQPTSKNVSWIINYSVPGKAQAMSCEVDGNTGEVFRLSKDLSSDPSAKLITAKTGFPTALAKAQQWNPAATLLSVLVEYPPNDSRTGPIDGVAQYWHFQFIVLPAPSGVDYQPAYDVVVGSTGLMNFRAGSTYADYATYGSQANWVTDSDEAFRVSEENGGKAYRDQHTDAQFGMGLNLGFYPVDELNTSKNVRWETGYSSQSDSGIELSYQIDGTTGELVSQR